MSNESQFLGIVQDGKFRPLTPDPGLNGYAELTTISMQESQPPEIGQIDKTGYPADYPGRSKDNGGQCRHYKDPWGETAPISPVPGRVSVPLLYSHGGTSLHSSQPLVRPVPSF